ncbi:methyl-CPG-binding domain 8 [Euphorbia peplus]|nr:methyl-CPG-binding domain 8 [Euphorbia peplus]
MTTTAAVADSSDRPNNIHSETIPVIDLHLLSQPELFSLSLCSSSASSPLDHNPNDPDVSTLKIDRSVFNESAGSRKQTFSRLRLAPRKNSQLSLSSPVNGTAELTSDEDSSRIVALLKSMFGGNPEESKIEGDLVPVPVKFNGFLDWNDVDGGVSDVAGADSKKRKRGRPRRDGSGSVGGDDSTSGVKDEKSVRVNVNATTEKSEEFGNMEDPYVKELTRRTIDMQTHEQLLEFLQGLDGEWLSKRKKRKIVGASELGDLLPSGWKLLLCVMKRAGYFWIGCRRFISPNGQQFMSCKEASSYLNSSLGLEDTSQLNFGVDGNIQMMERKSSENASDITLAVDKNEGALVCCPELSISKSVEHEKEPMKVGIPVQDETVREYKCHKCIMVFGEPDDLLEHLLSSHQKAPKRIKQETSFNEEVIINNGKYECQFCHKSYDERHRYNGHLGNHIKDYFKRTQASREALGIKRSSIPPSVAVHPSAMNVQDSPSVAVHPSAVNIQESTAMDIGSVTINFHSQCNDEIKDAVPDYTIKENYTKEPYCGNQGLVCSPVDDKSGDPNDTVAVETNTVQEGSPKFSFHAVGRKQMCAPGNNENQRHAQVLSSVNSLAAVSSIENSENIKDRPLSSAIDSVEDHNRDFVEEDEARTILGNNCSQQDVAANGEEQRNLTGCLLVPSGDGQRCASVNDVHSLSASTTVDMTYGRGSQVGLSPPFYEKIGTSNDKVNQVSNTTMKESGYDDIGVSSKDVRTVGFGSNNATVEDCGTGIELDNSSRSHLVIPTWVNQTSYTENEIGSVNTIDKLSNDATKVPNHDEPLHFQNRMHKKGVDLMESHVTAGELERCSGNSFLVPSGNEQDGAPKYLVQDINSDSSSHKPSSDDQIFNYENNLNMVSLVPVDQPQHKEVKSISKGDMHIAFDYSPMEWDADVRNTTPESYPNDYSLVTSGNQWNATEANLTGLYCSPLDGQEQASTKGLLHLSNSVEEWSAGQNSDRFLRGEDRKKLTVVKPRKNQAVTGIGSNNQASENVISGLVWKHDEENDLLGTFADTSRQLAHSSSCFTTYDLLSDKGGNELFGEKYSGISGFQGLRSGNMGNMEYNFMSNHSEETKIFSGDAEISQGLGSSAWVENGALPLLPKIAGRQRALCAWCKNEFHYEGFESEAQFGSLNFTCAACKAKFSGNFNFL